MIDAQICTECMEYKLYCIRAFKKRIKICNDHNFYINFYRCYLKSVYQLLRTRSSFMAKWTKFRFEILDWEIFPCPGLIYIRKNFMCERIKFVFL